MHMHISDPPDPQNAESVLAVMQPFGSPDAGDMSVRWNKRNPAEVEQARATFDAMKDKGYSAYKTNASGEKGEMIRNFDPDAERITMAPRMVGG